MVLSKNSFFLKIFVDYLLKHGVNERDLFKTVIQELKTALKAKNIRVVELINLDDLSTSQLKALYKKYMLKFKDDTNLELKIRDQLYNKYVKTMKGGGNGVLPYDYEGNQLEFNVSNSDFSNKLQSKLTTTLVVNLGTVDEEVLKMIRGITNNCKNSAVIENIENLFGEVEKVIEENGIMTNAIQTTLGRMRNIREGKENVTSKQICENLIQRGRYLISSVTSAQREYVIQELFTMLDYADKTA